MDQFTIKDIENLCRIKAHTLRAWEKRHNLAIPKRKASKRRYYDNEDLKSLLRISFLYHQGYKVSTIAGLTPEKIHLAVSETKVCEKNHEAYVHQLIEAGIDFDKDRFEKIIDNLTLCMGLENCITSVFYPFLQRIGLLWMTNHVIPAQEHFVSHIIRKKIICATDALEPASPDTKPVIIFSPPGEYHEIPLLVANYFLRRNKFRVAYFGTNVSLNAVRSYTEQNPEFVLFTHLVTHQGNTRLERFINELSASFPDQTILLSGPACKSKLMKEPLRYIDSLEQLLEIANDAYLGNT